MHRKQVISTKTVTWVVNTKKLAGLIKKKFELIKECALGLTTYSHQMYQDLSKKNCKIAVANFSSFQGNS